MSETDSHFEKFSRGASHRKPAEALTPLEWVTLVHTGALLVFASWAFGGNVPWARTIITWWGCCGALITATAVQRPELRARVDLRLLHWLWPIAALSAIIGLSCLNPNFGSVMFGSEERMTYTGDVPFAFLPSAARPDLTWRELLLYVGIYVSAFNLAFIVQRRRALRGLLFVAAANSLALSVLGSLQKFMGADLYFGLRKSPNGFFFSSFVYHNHWGAFTVLMLAVALGLVTYHARRAQSRGFFNSPAFLGLVAVFFIAATIPLSGSRSCSMMALILLIGAFIQWAVRLIRRRSAARESAALPLLGMALALIVALGVIYKLGKPTIEARLAKTSEQIGDMRARGGIGDRITLYRDTIQMGKAKPWFGWGLESYRTAFLLFNTQRPNSDGLQKIYEEAHSDWLQSFAEVGIVGTVLLVLTGLVPFYAAWRRRIRGTLPVYLFTGCALIAGYAWIEFPLSNPAVVIAFWILFFCAVRYVLLEKREGSAAN